MKKIYLVLTFILYLHHFLTAQDEHVNRLEISGSVDTYWKYDFSGYENEDGVSNIITSFADEQNSISVGMIDVSLSQTVGRAGFVGEFSFGPRSYKSIPHFLPDDKTDAINVGIQNLYISYAFTDFFSLTAGYMSTFIGYEVISPAGNFNYSTSYLFTNGPFQNAGIKADFKISDRFAVMVGIFNDWNVYHDFNGLSDFGAQIYFAPVDGWDVYVNFITGSPSGTEIDLTTGWQITGRFYLGLNAADYTAKNDAGGFYGIALYPKFSFFEVVELGVRYEYFKTKKYNDENGLTVPAAGNNAMTVTANITAGPLRLIPEFRIDTAGDEPFYKDPEGMEPAKSASQALIAVVYTF